ncbi:MAG TPA: CGNR zinc finger domain-containing protein [Actinomycetota bacterium]
MKRRKPIPEGIGEELEPGGRAPAPGSLRLVQQFVNTHNHEFEIDRDRLRTPAHARRWLVAHNLMEEGASLSERDRRRLVLVREAMREWLGATLRQDQQVMSHGILDDAARRARLTMGFASAGEPALFPEARGASGAMGRLLALLYDAAADGVSDRLKPCRECGWLFFDQSKNRSAEWCSMSICGNRMKNRSYRRRSSGAAGTRTGRGPHDP